MLRCPGSVRDVRSVSTTSGKLTIYYIEVNFIDAEIGGMLRNIDINEPHGGLR